MALIKIEPYIIDTTGDFTFNTVNATGNLSSLNANLGNLAIANFFSGSGNNLSNIQAANISGQVANSLISGTVYTNAQPNITSTGILTSLSVTGNITSGNANLGNLVTANFFSGNGSLLTGITVSAGNSIVNGNSNVSVVANGNITLSSAGNANIIVVTGTGANVTGYANVTGNLSANNITTGAGSGGSITGGNLVSANYITGTLTTAAQPNITSVGTLTSVNVTGNANTGNIGATGGYFTTIAGSLTTAAQPNITSVGTLTGITSTGTVNVTGASNVSLGPVGNVKITGGTANYVLQTDGAGNLSWAAISSGSSSNISNGNSNVNIPSANGNVNISAVGNANVLVVTGTGANISGTANITGNLVAGNITAGASGNITSGNANLGNSVTANYFIGTLYGTANLATYATTANAVAGANVSGAVSFATTANAVAGANVSGAVSFATTANSVAGANVSGQVSNSLVAGTVYTNAQPNITSTGTLSSLSVSGTTSLGAVGNVTITGGTNGYVLSTNGSGVLSWVAQSGGGGGAYTFTQVTPSTSWVINHNLGYQYVNIQVIDSTGNSFTGRYNYPTITFNNTTHCTVSFDSAQAGYAAVSSGGGSAANVTVDNFTGNGVQTVFTLSTTPIGINQTSVNYNGATVLRTDYTLANANITFSSAPANGSYIEVTTINLTAGGGGGTSAAAAVGYSLIFGG